MKLFLFVAFLLCSPKTLFPQQTLAATGGNLSGSSGTICYTLGQISYTSHENNSGKITQGVQQPYEILVITGIIDDANNAVNCSVFPNPATEHLTVRIAESDLRDIYLTLTKTGGVILLKQKITENETLLLMKSLPSGIYILEIHDSDKNIRSFKIIKTSQ